MATVNPIIKLARLSSATVSDKGEYVLPIIPQRPICL